MRGGRFTVVVLRGLGCNALESQQHIPVVWKAEIHKDTDTLEVGAESQSGSFEDF